MSPKPLPERIFIPCALGLFGIAGERRLRAYDLRFVDAEVDRVSYKIDAIKRSKQRIAPRSRIIAGADRI